MHFYSKDYLELRSGLGLTLTSYNIAYICQFLSLTLIVLYCIADVDSVVFYVGLLTIRNKFNS